MSRWKPRPVAWAIAYDCPDAFGGAAHVQGELARDGRTSVLLPEGGSTDEQVARLLNASAAHLLIVHCLDPGHATNAPYAEAAGAVRDDEANVCTSTLHALATTVRREVGDEVRGTYSDMKWVGSAVVTILEPGGTQVAAGSNAEVLNR